MDDQLHEKLMAFCSTTDHGQLLQTPIIKGGYQYYTNGLIAARVKTDEPDDDKPIQPGKLTWAGAGETEWQPLGDVSLVCTPVVMCITCDGAGWLECPHCGQEMECDSCNGDGETGGEWEPITISGVPFRGLAIRNMMVLPGIELAVADMAIQATERMPIRFRFDGGEGLVMPLHPDDIEERY